MPIMTDEALADGFGGTAAGPRQVKQTRSASAAATILERALHQLPNLEHEISDMHFADRGAMFDVAVYALRPPDSHSAGLQGEYVYSVHARRARVRTCITTTTV